MITYIHNCTKFMLLCTSNRVYTWTFYLLCLSLHTEVCLSERCDTVLYFCLSTIFNDTVSCYDHVASVKDEWKCAWSIGGIMLNEERRSTQKKKTCRSSACWTINPTLAGLYSTWSYAVKGLSVFLTYCRHDMCCFFRVHYKRVLINP